MQVHEQPRRPSGTIGEAKDQASEFLTFQLGDESYRIEILKVQEIRGYETPTAMANVRAFIKGVINLRVVVVSVLDLRIKFKLSQSSYGRIHGGDHPERGRACRRPCCRRCLGRADSARPRHSADPPEFSLATFDTRYITGLGSMDGRTLMLLDIEGLMTGSDMALVDSAIH